MCVLAYVCAASLPEWSVVQSVPSIADFCFFANLWNDLAMLPPFLKKRRIYLDYASATPLHADVLRAMQPYLTGSFGNPSATHAEGREARAVLEDARKIVADTLVTRVSDIVFTSGGTESNNLALFGVVDVLHAEGRAYADMEIITTAIEHPSILEPLRVLTARGVVVKYVPVDGEGMIDEKVFGTLLNEKTVLVTFAYANSEIGVVQEVKALARAIRLFKKKCASAVSHLPYFHLDASQAPLYLPCQTDSLGVDLMSIDAGKCNGPKGVGVLALRNMSKLVSHQYGGSQEGGLRPGTQNVALAVGCAAALERAQKGWQARAKEVGARRDFFEEKTATAFPTLHLNGSCTHRIANNLNISIPGIDGEFAVVGLDTRGIAASTRSACKTNESLDDGGSHVLRALGLTNDIVLGAIRFSLGEETTKKELLAAVAALEAHAHIVLRAHTSA